MLSSVVFIFIPSVLMSGGYDGVAAFLGPADRDDACRHHAGIGDEIGDQLAIDGVRVAADLPRDGSGKGAGGSGAYRELKASFGD